MLFGDDDNKRTWLGALLAFLEPPERASAGAEAEDGAGGRHVEAPRRAWALERALTRRGAPRAAAQPAPSGDGVERGPTRDEALSARAELSGIRFWPSEAVENRQRRREEARSA